MKDRFLKTFSIVLLISLFASVANITVAKRKKRKKNKAVPEWVLQRPVSEQYYVGIGFSNKENSDYMAVAKSNALKDLASEISVEIKSSTVISQEEKNNKFNASFNSIIESSVQKKLENYEISGSWENDEKTWFYVRLDKDVYKQKRRQQIEAARSNASSYFRKAEADFSENNFENAIINYIQAIYSIEDFLTENITVFTDNGSEKVVNASLFKINEIFQNTVFSIENESTILKVSFRGKPVSNTRFSSVFVIGGKRRIDLFNTSEEGLIELNKYETSSNIKKIRIKYGIERFLNNASEKLERKIVNRLILSQVIENEKVFILSKKEIFIFVESLEKILGKKNVNQPLARILKELLNKNAFNISNIKDSSNFTIVVEANTEKENYKEKYNLYFVDFSGFVKILNNKTNEEIYFTSFNGIRGTRNGSYRKASDQAYEEAKKIIEDKVIDEILSKEF